MRGESLTPNPRGVFYLDMAPKPKHIDCMRRSEEESFTVGTSSSMSQSGELRRSG